MKKKILTFVLTAVLFVFLAITAFAYSRGDVNNSGDITAADARLTLRYSASLQSFDAEQIAAADVDKSGEVTAADARTILRVSAGLDSFTSAEELNTLLIEPGILNVAVCADNPPFCYMKNGQLTGVDIDVAQKLANSYGLELKLHSMAYDELINSVKNNECDIALAKVNSGRNFNNQGAYTSMYYTNSQYIYYSYTSSFTSPEQLKSQNIGVIKNSVADLMLTQDVANGELGNAKIVRYTRYVDAVNALNNKSIVAFIGEGEFKFCDVNRYTGYYAKEDYCIVSSAEKSALSTKLAEKLKSTSVQQLVDGYCPPVVSDSSIKSEVSNVTLAPGATAIIKITFDSFYGNGKLVVKSSSSFNTSFKLYNGDYYLRISVPANAKSGEVVLCSNIESDVTCTIKVKVAKSSGAKYNFGTTSYCPDFGAFAGVAPDEVVIDTENQAIGYVYNADKLYNAGLKDADDYEKYLKLLEKQGFVADSYMTDDSSYYMLFYANEALEQGVGYTEYYYFDGVYLYLTAVSVVVSHQF